jgi:hypothetical protein
MRKVLICGGLAIAVVAAAVWGIHNYVRGLGPRARAHVVKALSDRFDADVSLATLQLYLFPSPRAVGTSLSIRHRGWPDSQPLIAIKSFTADATFFNLFFLRYDVRLLRLEGLRIHVPHRGPSTTRTTKEDDEVVETKQPGGDRTQLGIQIAEIIADGTQLQIDPKDASKDPLQFDIGKLQLRSVGQARPLRFDAVLKNPKPPGLINSSGEFGPWQKEDPRTTAVFGKYDFRNADLSVFNGLRGILSSHGTYGGVLQHIEVQGETDTPQFALRKRGSPVHLRTKFRSVVNGMTGDTILDTVDARFLNSEFLCKGDVTRQVGKSGKTVNLVAFTRKTARMEDILHLVMDAKTPFITGDVDFQSKIVIRPGHEEIIRKLQLNGQFHLTSGVFTNQDVNEKIVTLSNRARGIPKSEQARLPQQTVASDFSGQFKLDNGVLSLSKLSFAVPGATVTLHGIYNMPSRSLDLKGLFRMGATLSETQSGLKHWLLKPLDPVFEKDGAGLELPFDVTGSQEHPTLSVSAFHHTFRVE